MQISFFFFFLFLISFHFTAWCVALYGLLADFMSSYKFCLSDFWSKGLKAIRHGFVLWNWYKKTWFFTVKSRRLYNRYFFVIKWWVWSRHRLLGLAPTESGTWKSWTTTSAEEPLKIMVRRRTLYKIKNLIDNPLHLLCETIILTSVFL